MCVSSYLLSVDDNVLLVVGHLGRPLAMHGVVLELNKRENIGKQGEKVCEPPSKRRITRHPSVPAQPPAVCACFSQTWYDA